jgi:hypothetical protein
MMTENERYLFDLQGFLLIEDVLGADDLEDLNRGLDEYNLWEKFEKKDPFFEFWENKENHISAGPLHRFAKPFRRLMGHPRIVQYLVGLLGNHFRYDHGHAMLMKKGGASLSLHGGAVPWTPGIQYGVADNQIHCELLVVAYTLCDVNEGDGGLCLVPGSHKSNFPCPESFASLEGVGSWLRRLPQKAGSAVIFTEALTHGTWPWTAAHERRVLFYRYTPGYMAFVGRYGEDRRERSGGGYSRFPPESEEEWSSEERRILEAPYLFNRADTISGK